MSFALQNLSVKKGDNLILKNINYEEDGTYNWAILGENGSGKSTFLDILAGKVFPANGKIIKDKFKKVVCVNRDYAFHKIVGSAYQYYQQRYNAYDAEIGPTVYEVLQNQILPIGTVNSESVTLPPLAHSVDTIDEVSKKFRIEHLLQRKVTSLSNGETRRTLLAYWFLQKPDILLLDNPFSGLDAETRADLKQIIGTLEDVQVFLVADYKDLPNNFTKVIQLEEGELIYSGEIEGRSIGKEVQSYKGLHEKLSSIHALYPEPLIEFKSAVKLVNVNVEYGSFKVLKNINWEVKVVEHWAVLGPNGSGKSTLMSLLTGDNPQSYRNEIYLFDKKRGSGESIWDIKKRIGFVSPELHLYFHKFTPVWKVIGSGFFDTMGLFRKLDDNQQEKIATYLELFGLEKLKDRQLNQLSSGQQRLVLLIRALVKNPQMLILDEPCQGLDHNQMVYFRDTLNEIVLSQNKTLIYITHYAEEIPACVDKKMFLEEGEISKIEM